MANSRRFGQLLKRLSVLEGHFLPAQLSPTGQYTDKEEDHTRSYVLLVHAELEAYIEDRAKDLVAKAHDQWKKRNRCTKMMTRLLRHHLDSQKKPWKPIVKDTTAVTAAMNSYGSIVKGNNGVKEANLLSVLYPLGLEYRHFNTSWLATMDSFCSFRGSLAHSSQIKVQQAIDPQTESEKVKKQILPGLRRLDRKISSLG